MSDSLPSTADFVVVGGGVVGLTIALELRSRQPAASIVVLDKESRCGEHASGRNSGVIHAGFYYTADSLKAALTRDGNKRLTAWCEEYDVPIRRCGKLVVARDESEHAGLDELLRRSRLHGVPLEPVSEAQARELEPHARTAGRALFSPTTSAVDPRAVMARLVEQTRARGIAVHTETTWRGCTGRTALTSRGPIEAGYLVNAAGAYADRVAHAYGFGQQFTMLPFKGVYLYGNQNAPPLSMHVYPVPNLAMPFLGVHFTVTLDGKVKIGPTATPAFWREAYAPLLSRNALSRFRWRELLTVVGQGTRMLATDAPFRRHAVAETRKLSRSHLVRHAAELVAGVDVSQFNRWGAPGIRAQLLDVRRGQLVMDFHFEGDDRSMHVLNAVSPAFTCSLSFAEHLVDAIERQLG